MARRTAQELTTTLRDMFGEQTPDGYVELLEDITDSVGVFDEGEYVPKADYDAVVSERDAARGEAKDMRDRYINRFYQDYSQANDKGFVMGEASQDSLENEEEDLSYEALFE